MKKRKTSVFALFVVTLEILALMLSASACQKDFISKEEYNNSKPAVAEQKAATDIDGYKYSTDERPDAEDFDWYTSDVVFNGMPLDAEPFDSLGAAVGNWKGMIMYFLDEKLENVAIEMLNVNIDGGESEVYFIADWYSMNWIEDGEEEYGLESDIDDTTFIGTWSDGQLFVTVPEEITIENFYMKDGMQYALGTINTSGGYSGVVALCRP